MALKKYSICLIMLISTGYSMTADRNNHSSELTEWQRGLVRMREEREEYQERQHAQQHSLYRIQQNINTVVATTQKNINILSEELATIDGLDKMLLTPFIVGFYDGCHAEAINFLIDNTTIQTKHEIAIRCLLPTVIAFKTGLLSREECGKMLEKAAMDTIFDFAINPNVQSLPDNLIIRTTLNYPRLSLDKVMSKIKETNQRKGNEYVRTALPTTVHFVGKTIGSHTTRAALTYASEAVREKLAEAAAEKVVFYAEPVVRHVAMNVKPAVESYCSIQ